MFLTYFSLYKIFLALLSELFSFHTKPQTMNAGKRSLFRVTQGNVFVQVLPMPTDFIHSLCSIRKYGSLGP